MRSSDAAASQPERPTTTRRSSGWPSDSKRSEEHTSELQSRQYLVCRLLLEKKKNQPVIYRQPLQVPYAILLPHPPLFSIRDPFTTPLTSHHLTIFYFVFFSITTRDKFLRLD